MASVAFVRFESTKSFKLPPSFEVRPAGQAGWSKVDNEMTDEYVPLIGLEALGLYTVLARFSGSNGFVDPMSLRDLEKITGTGRNRIARMLQKLSEHGLVAIEDAGPRRARGFALANLKRGRAPKLVQPKVCPAQVSHAPDTPKTDLAQAAVPVAKPRLICFKDKDKYPSVSPKGGENKPDKPGSDEKQRRKAWSYRRHMEQERLKALARIGQWVPTEPTATEREEYEAYLTWQSCSERFRQENPWRGRTVDAINAATKAVS